MASLWLARGKYLFQTATDEISLPVSGSMQASSKNLLQREIIISRKYSKKYVTLVNVLEQCNLKEIVFWYLPVFWQTYCGA